jgi:dihydroorotate dehydrogenase (NAD+) catalytic subunit
MADLSVELAPKHKSGLRLRNPVIAASGTFGWGTEYASLMDVQRLGAISTKGITWRPRLGNQQPRIVETAAGMLNSIGLQNPGIREVVKHKAPVWAQMDVPVIANIAGESYDEFCRLAEALDGVPGVAALELNISCPNVESGLEFGSDPEGAAAVTYGVRQTTALPIIVKLTPNMGDVPGQARAVADAGADAITVINTVLGMLIDLRRRRPVIARGSAGLSGPAIKPIAIHLVYQVARAVDIPIIGCGGIATAQDALEFFMAGATAIQVGTANFVDPQASLKVIDGISSYLDGAGSTLGEIVGCAQA